MVSCARMVLASILFITVIACEAGSASKPDLTIKDARIELEAAGRCVDPNIECIRLGVRLTIYNAGNADAGPFVVNVNGACKTITSGLSVGQSDDIWFPGYVRFEDNSAILDIDDEVDESDENNNRLVQFLPVPTLPPFCTPTPGPPPTPGPSPTPTQFVPTLEPTVSPTNTPVPAAGPWPFRLMEDGVIYSQYPFKTGCNWLGIAGKVWDSEGEPITGIAVVLNGGGRENIITYSGDAPRYGPSGWEHYLGDKVVEDEFEIRLWYQGEPVSAPVTVQTREHCLGNLVYVLFQTSLDDQSFP